LVFRFAFESSSLIEELDLKKYRQYSKGISLFQTNSFEPAQEFVVPEYEPSYRITEGTQTIISVLKGRLPIEGIHLSTRVKAIAETDHGLIITTSDEKIFRAEHVVICMPPQLAAANISFKPGLPEHLRNLLPMVQTWMSGAIKFTIEYQQPFWRSEGYSGTLYSHTGIVGMMHDHSNMEGTKFGFAGFLDSGAAIYSREIRQEKVLYQLRSLLGKKVMAYSSYFDKVWTDEYVMPENHALQYLHQNNGHPLLRSTFMNGKLSFCGSETASHYPGYMEGAVTAAKFVSACF
jgi:monoamine oxidase